MNPSNPVSHASGEADTPFCFAVVGTSTNPKIKDWYAGSWQHEANADRAVEINNASSRSVARQLGEEVSSTYRKEPLCLASTLSSLRAEHAALKTENAKLWNTLSMTRDDVFVGWGDVELLDPTLERLDATLNAGARDP